MLGLSPDLPRDCSVAYGISFVINAQFLHMWSRDNNIYFLHYHKIKEEMGKRPLKNLTFLSSCISSR